MSSVHRTENLLCAHVTKDLNTKYFSKRPENFFDFSGNSLL